MVTQKEKIVLGSGQIYTTEFDGTLPDIETIAVEENKLGAVKGGANVDYKADYYTTKSDDGTEDKTVITDEDVVLKSGLMTFCGNTIAKVCSTARVTEDKVTGKRTIKVGGLKNYNGKKYVILFLYDDPTDGQMGIIIVGQNQTGFSLSYVKDKETVLDVEFKASSQDAEGTLLQIVEDIPKTEILKDLAVTSTQGTESGTTDITVTPGITSGRTYVYTTASGISAPALNEVLNNWNIWDGISDITATTGDKIGIAEIDTSLKCKAYGETTITSMA